MPPMPSTTQQVCDNCRLRKTKCDRGQPCSSCASYAIPCQYLHSLRRRGPKGGKGRRLNLIKLGLAEQLGAPLPDGSLDIGHYDDASMALQGDGYLQGQAALSSTSVPAPALALRHGCSSQHSQPSQDGLSARDQTMSATIMAHVKTFMAHLFPIMPAVDGIQLLSDAANLETLSAPRHALLLSLCAVTRIQLRLDQDIPLEGENYVSGLITSVNISGAQFLAAAERARQQFSLADNMGQDAILTSFFLFVSNGNLEKYNHAWFYLSQSISMALLLGYDRDPSPVPPDMSIQELNMRRRIFWLLFITERTYALQRRMPVLMRGSIARKPEVLASDCPMIMNDFLNHIRLFESLPASLYDWQDQDNAKTARGNGIGHVINEQLCSVEPGNSILESQHFDTLVTQQWLRVAMWRLSYGILPSVCNESGKALSFTLPFDAGKAIMASLACVTNKSKDCHGISIEQKLFDIGLSLVDIATFASVGVPGIQVGPQDLLYAIVKTLGCVRGRQSRYLPNLLDHSQIVLGLEKYSAHKSLPMPTRHGVESIEYLATDTVEEATGESLETSNDYNMSPGSYRFNDSRSDSSLTVDEELVPGNTWSWPTADGQEMAVPEIATQIQDEYTLSL